MKRLALLAIVGLTACTTVPPTNVHQPMSVRPSPRLETHPGNGAIYQAAASRPLFEDRRARFVGDTLTIKIAETTSASTESKNNVKKANTQTATLSAATGVFGQVLPGAANLSAGSTTDFKGSGDAGNKNAFEGYLTATVIDVLPNGNLLVSGEKQLAIGHEQEFVRVSGIVNPSFLDYTNSIESSKVADARIEYKSAGQVSEGQVMGWLARFFLNVMPF